MGNCKSDRPISQIPQCICPISHYTPLWNRFLFQSGVLWDMGQMHCGICETGLSEYYQAPTTNFSWDGLLCLTWIFSLQKSRLMKSYDRINTLRPRQNGRHVPDDIFKCIFLNQNVWISIEISLKFIPKGPINNIPALVRIMNQWWLVYQHIYASLGLNELRQKQYTTLAYNIQTATWFNLRFQTVWGYETWATIGWCCYHLCDWPI